MLSRKFIVITILSHINTSIGFNMFSNRRSFLQNIVMMSNYNNFDKLDNFFVPNINLDNLNDNQYNVIDNIESINNENNNNENNNNNNNNNEIDQKQIIPKKNQQFKNNIYFTGQLTEETCFKLSEALIQHKNKLIVNQDLGNHINLFIQSPGGSLLPTLALVDEIKNLEIPVHTYIRGYAASAATLLSVVGKQRYIYNHSLMMIHGVKFGDENVIQSYPDLKDLNHNADIFIDIIKDIYLSNSDIDEKTLNEMYYHDKWMNSHQALKYGLVDEIL